MKQVLNKKRGMSLIELFFYMMVSCLIVAFFVYSFWRIRKTHEQQNLEMSYQGSFARLCDQLERDLAGCRSWQIQNVVGSSTSLFVERLDGQIAYDVNFDTGDIIRGRSDGSLFFPFKGEREGILKTMIFATDSQNLNAIYLKIELKTVPEIALTHDFTARISKNREEGFFGTPLLEEPGAEAHIGNQ